MPVNMHAILVGLLSVSHTPEQADHAARSVLDQHAHQLAEEIREWAKEDGGAPEYGSIDNVLEAADRIDPEKP